MGEENMNQSKILKLNVQLIENDLETTVLEGYLKNELDSLISNSKDTLAWKEAKELLGTKLVTKDLELDSYKSKYHYSTALNISLILGFITYRFFSQRN
jgi:hypothetical protein